MGILRYILLTSISLLIAGAVWAGAIIVTFEETQPSAAAVSAQCSTNADYMYYTDSLDGTNKGTAGPAGNIVYYGSPYNWTFITNVAPCWSLDGNDAASPGAATNTGNGATSFTFFAWIYVQTWSAFDAIFCSRGTVGTFLDLYNDVGEIGFIINNGAIGAYISDSGAYTTGAWYHVVGTADTAGRNALYINGTEYLTNSISGWAPMAINAVWKIGVDAAGADRWFVGCLGGPLGFAINKVPSAGEVSNEYNYAKADYGH